MDNYKLDDCWTLWYHELNNDNWTIGGYQELVDIETVDEFWKLYNTINDFSTGMFFLMRKGCLPIWESYKTKIHFVKYRTGKKFYMTQWMDLCKAAIGETITTKSKNTVGISISPKFKNMIIRIWTFDDEFPSYLPELKIDAAHCMFE